MFIRDFPDLVFYFPETCRVFFFCSNDEYLNCYFVVLFSLQAVLFFFLVTLTLFAVPRHTWAEGVI